MSLRYFTNRVYKNSRYIVKYLYRRHYGTNVDIKCAPPKISNSRGTNRKLQFSARNDLRSVAARYGLQVKRVLLDNVTKKTTNPFITDLRRRAARRFLSGDSVPFFALIGVSMATGSGVLSREDEIEVLCLDIRDAISKIQWNGVGFDQYEELLDKNEIGLNDLTFYDQPIAKGCSGIVYAAKLQPHAWEKYAPLKSVDNIDLQEESPENKDIKDGAVAEFPLALKMMFNYDIESNAVAILNTMFNETVPARRYNSSSYESYWTKSLLDDRAYLPPHPNIVAMYGVFVDYVDQICNLNGSKKLIPAVQPKRLYEYGYGRNKSLFLLMKRYQYSLEDYIKKYAIGSRTCVLLLTQLLEGVAHMNLHGIAHRDLKSDNILVDILQADKGEPIPIAVITDFGCCLAEKSNGLLLNYNSRNLDLGGNSALMAPEIISQIPGTYSVLNYSKSDLWAVGTIAYEVFGKPNPFWCSRAQCGTALTNSAYEEVDLPDLGDKAPPLIKKLVRNILSKNPNKRLSAEVAANVCQIYMWAPSSWMRKQKMPSSNEILQWLLFLTTRVLYECRIAGVATSAQKKLVKSTYSEYILISSFLSRASMSQIKQALRWIQANNYII